MANFRTREPWSTRQLAAMALLCSVSLLLSFVEFPIFPAAPFLKYDASFVPIMIAGFAYGPGPGMAVGLVEVALHGLFVGDVPGSIMNALVVVGFVLPASLIYLRKHDKTGAFIGLAVSSVASVGMALAGNLVITPFYMGVPLDTVLAMMVPILIPFNILKAVINSLLTAIAYKGISNVLKPKHERTPAKMKALPAIEALAPTEMAIEFDQVGFSYDRTTPVLRDVSLQVPAGQFVAILGGNGSGKSTLARHINGLLLPDSGTVRIFGTPTSDRAKIYSIRRSAGLVFQSPADQLVASIVEDDVAFGPENLGIPQDQIAQRVADALERVGLADLAQADVSTLSGGQQQRVAIAGILAMEPQIIVFDEASSMLDPQGRMDFLRIVTGLHRQGMTVLMITHNLAEAQLADRIFVMESGRIIADRAPEDILGNQELLRRAHLSYNLDELRGAKDES